MITHELVKISLYSLLQYKYFNVSDESTSTKFVVSGFGVSDDSLEHSRVVVVIVLFLLEKHKVYKKDGTEQGRLHLHIQVNWKTGTESR